MLIQHLSDTIPLATGSVNKSGNVNPIAGDPIERTAHHDAHNNNVFDQKLVGE